MNGEGTAQDFNLRFPICSLFLSPSPLWTGLSRSLVSPKQGFLTTCHAAGCMEHLGAMKTSPAPAIRDDQRIRELIESRHEDRKVKKLIERLLVAKANKALTLPRSA